MTSDGEDIDKFLQGIKELGDKRREEDLERNRRLEEQLIADKIARRARRDERAKSLSFSQAGTPSGGHQSAASSRPGTRDGADDAAQADSSIEALSGKLAGVTGNTGEAGTAPEPSKRESSERRPALSWQRRPKSMYSISSSRPQSSTSKAAESSDSEGQDLNRAQIAPNLEGKQPEWFRQASERNATSSALRKDAEEGMEDRDKMALPDLTPAEPVEERVQTPEPEPEKRPLSSTGRGSLENQTPPLLNRTDSLSSVQRLRANFNSPSSLHSRNQSLDSPMQFRPISMSPSQGRLTEPRDRTPSPTKGVGGFVQSAMLKREGSINKRWSAQNVGSLSRSNSISTGDGPPNLGSINVEGTPPSKEPSVGSEFPHGSESHRRARSRTLGHGTLSKSVSGGDISANASPLKAGWGEAPQLTSSRTFDQKRWSPTKSSWLESALKKGNESPASQPSSPVRTPRQLVGHVSVKSLAKSMESPTESKSPVRSGSPPKLAELSKEPIDTAKVGPISPAGNTTEKPLGKPDDDKPKPAPKPSPFGSSPTVKPDFDKPPMIARKNTIDFRANLKSRAPIEKKETAAKDEKPVETSPFSKPKPTIPAKAAAEPPTAKPAFDKPGLGHGRQKSSIDFRAGLKSRPVTDKGGNREDLPFLNAMSKLKATKTGTFKPNTEFKDSLVEGKTKLSETSGPQKNIGPDPVKEQLASVRGSLRRSDTLTSQKSAPSSPLKSTPNSPLKSSPSSPVKPPSPAKTKSFPLEAETEVKPIEPVRPALKKQASAPASSVEAEKKNSLADRFNPNLANLLQRGPPAGSSGRKGDSSTPNEPEEPAAGATLTHMTKGRARGPKRRAPTKADPVKSEPKRSEPTNIEPAKAEPAKPVNVSPFVPKPAATADWKAELSSKITPKPLSTPSTMNAKPTPPLKSPEAIPQLKPIKPSPLAIRKQWPPVTEKTVPDAPAIVSPADVKPKEPEPKSMPSIADTTVKPPIPLSTKSSRPESVQAEKAEASGPTITLSKEPEPKINPIIADTAAKPPVPTTTKPTWPESIQAEKPKESGPAIAAPKDSESKMKPIIADTAAKPPVPVNTKPTRPESIQADKPKESGPAIAAPKDSESKMKPIFADNTVKPPVPITTKPSRPESIQAEKPKEIGPAIASRREPEERITPTAPETPTKPSLPSSFKSSRPESVQIIDKAKPPLPEKSKPSRPDSLQSIETSKAPAPDKSPLLRKASNISVKSEDKADTPPPPVPAKSVTSSRSRVSLKEDPTPPPPPSKSPDLSRVSSRENERLPSPSNPTEVASPVEKETPPSVSVKNVAALWGKQAVSNPQPPPQAPISPAPNQSAPPPSAPPKPSEPQRERAKSRALPKLPSRSPSPEATHSTIDADSAQLLTQFFKGPPLSAPRVDFDINALFTSKPSEPQKVFTVKFVVSEITGNGKITPVPADQDYVLFDESMYLCVHTFENAPRKNSNEVYLWSGDKVGESAVQDAMIFARKTAKDNGCKLIHLTQGHEAPGFLQAIGGILLVRRGPQQTHVSSSSFILCGRSCCGGVAFDEVDFSLSSLSSGFVYVIYASERVYIWQGKGATADEIGVARLVGFNISGGEFTELYEGTEKEEVVTKDLLPGARVVSADYWHLKPRSAAYATRLFRIDMESAAKIVEVFPYAQSNLDPAEIYVADAFFEFYIVLGAKSHSKRDAFQVALQFTQEYALLAVSVEDRPFIPLSNVILGGAPREFKALFRSWDDSKMPTWMPSRKPSLRLMGLEKAMGVMGV